MNRKLLVRGAAQTASPLAKTWYVAATIWTIVLLFQTHWADAFSVTCFVLVVAALDVATFERDVHKAVSERLGAHLLQMYKKADK